jgi:phage-related protein
LAAFDQDIFFQGNLYARYPLEVEILETPTHAALVQLRVTVGNVDQQLQSLLETYWAPQATPRWEVFVWEIDTTDPNQVPFSAAEVFSVQQVTTDLVSAQFDLTAEGLTLGTIVPRRRFTASSGFLNLPRRTR